jgi:hypothetical protein
MADEQQTIILEINVKDSLTKTAELKASINELISQRQQLAEAAKKGDEDAAKGLEAVNVAVRLQQQEYRTQTKILDGYVASKKQETDTLEFANNSIQQNRDLLKQLTAQYITLKAPSAEATKQIKDLSDQLKVQEGAIGNNTRNVGNYKEAFVDAFQSITSAVPALKGFQMAQLGVNAAMDANPIGLVVIGIQALTGAFSSFKPVVEAVEKSLNAMTAGFAALINGGDVVAAAQQAAQLTEELNDLEDAQNGVNIANAEYDAQISLLLIKLRSKSITEKEAEKVSAEIQKLSEARFNINTQQQEALLKNKEDRFMAENAISQRELDALVERGKVIGILSEKELASVEKVAKDTGIAKEKLIADAIEAQIVLADLTEKRIIGSDKEKQQVIDDIAAMRAANLGIAAQRDELEQKVSNFNEKLSQRFEAERDKRNAAKDKEAEDDSKRIAKLESDNDKQVAIEQNKLNDEIEAVKKAEAEKKKAKEDAYKEQLYLQNQTSAEYLKKVDETAKAELAIEKQKGDKIIALIQYGLTQASTIVGLISQALQQGSQERLDSFKANAEAEKATLQGQLEHGKISKKKYNQEIAKIDAVARQKESEEKRKQWEIAKGIQITNAIIQTAQAVLSAYSSGAAYPLIGPATGAVFAAIAGALGAVQIGIIASQQPPKFAKGVIGLDGEGTETSDDIPAYLSKGESVVTAKATRRFHRELAEMEMAVGNSPNYQFGRGMFAGGYIPTVDGDGGFVSRDISRNSDQFAMMQQAIRNGFALAPAPNLSIVEFETKQNNRNRSVNISEA